MCGGKPALAGARAGLASVLNPQIPILHSRLTVVHSSAPRCAPFWQAKRRWRLSLEWRREERIDTILDEPQPYFDLIKQVCVVLWGCGGVRRGLADAVQLDELSRPSRGPNLHIPFFDSTPTTALHHLMTSTGVPALLLQNEQGRTP